MKTGTDAVLLAAWCDVSGVSRILDIGTGCGLIALIMAQRTTALITAIDIDEDSVLQACKNFQRSPWSNRLFAQTISLQDYQDSAFDLLISNPPYFSNALKVPDNDSRNNARHNHFLSFDSLARHAVRLLNHSGKFCLILPPDEFSAFESEANIHHLFLQKLLLVYGKPESTVKRKLGVFGFESLPLEIESLIIRDDNGQYTDDYRHLTSELYLNF
jgi:tRNA1Val (adenine37-N6)-methyltransferase